MIQTTLSHILTSKNQVAGILTVPLCLLLPDNILPDNILEEL